MDKDDVLNSLKGGFSLASKLVGKSVDEVTKVIRKSGDDHGGGICSGLSYIAPRWRDSFSLEPRLCFHESQTAARTGINLLQNITMSSGEKAFVTAIKCLTEGEEEQALLKLREATSQGRESKVQLTDAYFLLGILLMLDRSYEDALRNFKTALLCQQSLGRSLRKYLPSLHAEVPLTRYSVFCLAADLLGLNVLLSITYRLKGEVEESIRTLEQLLEVMPADPMALFFVNLFRLERGLYRDVFDSLHKVLPDNNLKVASIVLLGLACINLGDPDTGEELFHKALQRPGLDKDLRIDLQYSRALALEARGFSQEAQRTFRDIEQRAPGYVPIPKRLLPPTASHSASHESSGSTSYTRTTEISEPSPTPEAAEEQTHPPSMLHSVNKDITYELKKHDLIIGREEGDLILKGDDAASRLHAKILYQGDAYWIEDLGSTNGTWINGRRITGKSPLKRGDILQIGNTLFELK